MLEIKDSTAFRRDVKRLRKRGKDMEKLYAVVNKMAEDISFHPRHRPHLLSGDWAGYWEVHIEPDWLEHVL